MLLAKTINKTTEDKEGSTLVGHSSRTVRAIAIIGDILADKICSVLGITDFSSKEVICIASLSGYLHDLGKANVYFQNMVNHREPNRQIIRHEVLSAMMSLFVLKDWLQCSEEILPVVILAVLGHHHKGHRFTVEEIPCKGLTVYFGDKDFNDYLKLAPELFGLSPQLPDLDRYLTHITENQLERWGQDLIDYAEDAVEAITLNPQLEKLAMAVRWLLMSGDGAASALLKGKRGERDYEEWISDALN